MKNMMILEIDAQADFDLMSDELKKAVGAAQVEWDIGTISGSQEVLEKRLILVQTSASKQELTDLMNTDEFDEEGNQIAFNLGWSVVACEDEAIDESLILPYMVDQPVFDESGDILSYEPVISVKDSLPVYGGKKWTY